MTDIKAFLPPSRTLTALGRLRAPVRISRLARSVYAPYTWSALWLSDPDTTLRLRVDAHDVAWKFEAFELASVEEPLPPDTGRIEVGQISGWDAVRYLFRFEWQRPATPAEARHAYGHSPLLSVWGKFDEIPHIAPISAVTMTGIAFWNDARNGPLAITWSGDSDPFIFRLIENTSDIAAVLAECEVVRPNDVSHWSRRLRASAYRRYQSNTD